MTNPWESSSCLCGPVRCINRLMGKEAFDSKKKKKTGKWSAPGSNQNLYICCQHFIFTHFLQGKWGLFACWAQDRAAACQSCRSTARLTCSTQVVTTRLPHAERIQFNLKGQTKSCTEMLISLREAGKEARRERKISRSGRCVTWGALVIERNSAGQENARVDEY